MRSAEEIAKENKLEYSKEVLEYIQRYMRFIYQKRVWAEDMERECRVDEMEFAMKTFLGLDDDTIFLFAREALMDKYGAR